MSRQDPQVGDTLPCGFIVRSRSGVKADDEITFCWLCERVLLPGKEAVWAVVSSTPTHEDIAGFHLPCATIEPEPDFKASDMHLLEKTAFEIALATAIHEVESALEGLRYIEESGDLSDVGGLAKDLRRCVDGLDELDRAAHSG